MSIELEGYFKTQWNIDFEILYCMMLEYCIEFFLIDVLWTQYTDWDPMSSL